MLQVNKLTIKYGKRIIIDNQDISFERGKITGIKGISGAGKSSLLNVLGLIKTPNKECQYWYEGKRVDIFNEKDNSLFRMNHIGFIFQQGNLMKNLSSIENVILPQLMCENDEKKIKNKANEWIEYVGLENVKDSYPEDLSGGEEQRIAIARALINDCDIILADEPTASLDSENSRKVMQLLKRLAHDLNKIVIIVSHDDETVSYSDIVYEISNGAIKMHRDFKRNNDREMEFKNKGSSIKEEHSKQKKIGAFIRKYDKLRRKEYKLNKILIFVSAFIVAIASLSVGFGDAFSASQKKFVNSISDRSLLVINDTLGIDATADYEEAVSFDKEAIEFIENIPKVDKLFPFYAFASYGMTPDFDGRASVTIYRDDNNILVEREYENTYVADGNEFYVSPIFDEENMSSYLIEGSLNTLDSDSVYLTHLMATDLTDNVEGLIGKEIEINCYVPTKLYISEATKPKSKAENEKGVSDEMVEIDGCVSKLVKIEKKVAGILNNSYQNDKNTNNGKMILMNYETMSNIIDYNKETLESRVFPDYEEKLLEPSMLVVYVSNFDDLKDVENKISNYSPFISVINRSGDIEETKNNLAGIKYTMLAVSAVLIVIVTIMFSLLYYFKNRDRKGEIGILKALGLNQMDVLKLIGMDMVKNTLLTFGASIAIGIVMQILSKMLFGIEVITVSMLSVLLAFIISVVTVFMSGMLSVWKTSKIDVIDAIRLNK